MTIPSYVKKYFWDSNIHEKDIKKHPQYIISRLLEYGDEKAIAWLKRQVTRAAIIKSLKESRQLSPISAHFWAGILDVPKKEILCLKKPFLKRRLKHWLW